MSRVLVPLLAALLAVCVLPGPRNAHAACPVSGSPDRSVCRYFSGALLPSVTGQAYFPDGQTWLGAGFELVLYAWSDNSARRGPGQGKVSLDIAALAAGDSAGDSAGGAMDTGTMIKWSGGANVSFERSASRAWLIPFWGLRAGGIHERTLGRHLFAEAQLGVHLWWSPRLVLDVAGGYLLPFSDADRLAGARAELSLAVSLW